MEANLKKLELLYDHTKFHIGFCLILTSAYITLVTSKIGRKDALPVLQPALAWLAVALFMVAGIAAGVVASSATQSKCNGADDFLNRPVEHRAPPREAVGPHRAQRVLARRDLRGAVVCVLEVKRVIGRG